MTRFALWIGLALTLAQTLPAAAQVPLEAMARRMQVAYDDVPAKVLAFYYPWYGNPDTPGGSGRWTGWKGADPDRKEIENTAHYPALGAYDSHAPQVIARHCRWANEAGVDGFIVSWWGHDSYTDRAMPQILDECGKAELDVTIYYETVPDPKNADSAAEDVLKVVQRYADHPAWLRVDGKPVVLVYGRAAGEIGLKGWLEAIAQINRRYTSEVALIGDRMSRSAARVFDGIHTYNTAGILRGKSPQEVRQWAEVTYTDWVGTAEAFSRISSLTVIPGYDDTKIRQPGLKVERFDGELYRAQWEEAIEANPDWVLVTSWNEWYEGSDIEPSVEFGEQYLKLTAQYSRRFKEKSASVPTPKGKKPSQPLSRQALGRLARAQVGLLPDGESAAVWTLVRNPLNLKALSWPEVTQLSKSTPDTMPVLIATGDETYRQTVDRPGDVDEGIRRYLGRGGFLVVLPAGPMPFHYNRQRQPVGSSSRFGLPLSVSGKGGGWEEPPQDVELKFVQPDRHLPSLPQSFPFPEQGDLRWRPFVRSEVAGEHRYVPLLELRDDSGKHYGDAAAFVQYKSGPLAGAKVLYVWFGLVNASRADSLVNDVLRFVAKQLD